MRIAIVGTGDVGSALGAAFTKAGHDVVYGSRNPADSTGRDLPAPVAAIAPAIGAAEVVVVALPGSAVEGFARGHGAALAGRLVVDAANKLGAPVLHSAADFAAHAPGARYARAFNTLGWENFVEPTFGGTPADLYYSCAAADRPVLEELVRAVGLRPVCVGANKADVLDGVLRLWFALAVGEGRGRHLAFRMLADSTAHPDGAA